MAGNVRKKPGRKSRGRDDGPFLLFSPEDCPLAVPAAGNRNGTDLNNRGSNGNYWSATLNENNSNNAYNLNFNSGKIGTVTTATPFALSQNLLAPPLPPFLL